eukprot:scaffold12719_cov103-Skeletonema_dohrnii-CCMP3373.AAC.6
MVEGGRKILPKLPFFGVGTSWRGRVHGETPYLCSALTLHYSPAIPTFPSNPMLLHLYTAAALLFLVGIHPIHYWQQWNYSSYSTDEWRLTWSLADGPNARRGHSLVLFNDTKLILFGGRGNDAHRVH